VRPRCLWPSVAVLLLLTAASLVAFGAWSLVEAACRKL
jgi:hypothetical protein